MPRPPVKQSGPGDSRPALDKEEQMFKKSIFAACLAALALAALPAIASAMHPNPYLAENEQPIAKNAPFTIAGGTADLETTGNNFVHCETTTGSGEFTSPETGTISVIFHECTTIFGITCTTPGQPTGTITTPEALKFHLKTVEHPNGVHGREYEPGVLITPTKEPAHGQFLFAAFECSFAGGIEVTGNGLVGTIEFPDENTPSNEAKIVFQKEKPGHQTHRTVTNDEGVTEEFDLKSSVNGGETETASEEATGVITFNNGTEPEIRTTAE
jgi:hypothetical protein